MLTGVVITDGTIYCSHQPQGAELEKAMVDGEFIPVKSIKLHKRRLGDAEAQLVVDVALPDGLVLCYPYDKVMYFVP